MIGLTIWATQWTFRHTIEYYMVSPVWWVPPLVVATGIFLVSIIPDPIDDCPCFDDCVAFIAVLMGLIPASIHFASTSYSSNYPVPATIPYSSDLGVVKSVLRLVFGVGTLFVWRLAAKKALYVLLPPIYKLFSLPYRPHFIPASTYNTLSTYPIGKVPSVIDLPSMAGNVEIVGLQSAMDVHEKFSLAAAAQALEQEGGLRARKAGAGVNVSGHQEINMDERRDESSQHGRDASILSNGSTECGDDSSSDSEKRALYNGHHHHSYHSKESTKIEDEAEALLRVERMHPSKSRFDVDIVSKLVVYAGIGALAVDGIPILFEIVGLGSPVIRI